MIEDIRSAVSRILVSSKARGLDFSPVCPDELGRESGTELDVTDMDVMEPDNKSTLGV